MLVITCGDPLRIKVALSVQMQISSYRIALVPVSLSIKRRQQTAHLALQVLYYQSIPVLLKAMALQGPEFQLFCKGQRAKDYLVSMNWIQF